MTEPAGRAPRVTVLIGGHGTGRGRCRPGSTSSSPGDR